MPLCEMPAAAAGADRAAPSPDSRQGRRSRWVLFGPAVLFIALVLAFGLGLGRDPKLLPSPLIGKPVPQFDLPPVKGRTAGLATADLNGEVSLVNVFASWCAACRDEHPVLMGLKKQGWLPIHGLNYKDKPSDAARWLEEFGDPYTRTGADLTGQVGIDWGVYGVPETFVVDAYGRIAFKQVGPITPDILDKVILPIVASLRAKPSGPGAADAGPAR